MLSARTRRATVYIVFKRQASRSLSGAALSGAGTVRDGAAVKDGLCDGSAPADDFFPKKKPSQKNPKNKTARASMAPAVCRILARVWVEVCITLAILHSPANSPE